MIVSLIRPSAMRHVTVFFLLIGALWAEDRRLALTPAETKWVREHPVVRWGYDGKYEPYAVVEADGKVSGMDADYLRLISERTGLVFEPHTAETWSAVMADFRANRLDLLSSLSQAPGREKYMTYSVGYSYSPDVIVTRDDAPIIFDISNLQGRTVAVPLGFVGIKEAIETGAPRAVVRFYPNMAECYKAVSHGEVFAAFSDLPNAAYVIQTQRMSNLRLGVIVSDTAQNYFGIRKDWPELASIMDKALQSMTTDERKQISNRWISVSVADNPRWQTAARILGVLTVLIALVALGYGYRHHMLGVALRASATAQQRLEATNAELLRTQAELAKANQAQADMMRMVAHDLRSPLTGLLMQAGLMKMEAGAAEREAAEMIHLSAARMVRMVDDLMDAHAPAAGQANLARQRTDVSEAVRASIGAFAGVAVQKHIRIDFSGPADGAFACTDASACQRVVENLLTNALKYSPPGSRVGVRVEVSGVRVVTSITDQGPGVPARDRSRIFEKYGMGTARPTSGERASGLGLWIVAQLTRSLGGTIEVGDNPTGGAVFTFTIPRDSAA